VLDVDGATTVTTCRAAPVENDSGSRPADARFGAGRGVDRAGGGNGARDVRVTEVEAGGAIDREDGVIAGADEEDGDDAGTEAGTDEASEEGAREAPPPEQAPRVSAASARPIAPSRATTPGLHGVGRPVGLGVRGRSAQSIGSK
jgi:hypothetical protein